MAQILVRNLDDSIRDALRDRAREHGRSMEEEVRDILRSAVFAKDRSSAADVGLGTWMSRTFREIGLRPHEQIQELRGSLPQVPEFGSESGERGGGVGGVLQREP